MGSRALRRRNFLRAVVVGIVGVLTLVLVGATATGTPAGPGDNPPGEPLACGQEINRTDENGTFNLRFQCLPDRGLVDWGFQMSPSLRAIITGPVTEQGLMWWQNGRPASQNSPHVEPADYIFHGRLNPVFVGDDIDYQDLFTFRVNYGGQSGSGRATVAGSVRLTP